MKAAELLATFEPPYPEIPASLSAEEHNRRVRANARAWELWCDGQLELPEPEQTGAPT